MGKKKKMPTIVAPQTDADADALLREYGDIQRTLEAQNTGLADAVAQVKAYYEGLAKPLNARAEEIFAGLSVWAAANRDRLTDGGKSKQAKLPAGTVGWRTNPPSIAFARGVKADAILAALKEMKLKRFIRTTETVNKDAMLDDKTAAAAVPGVIIRTGEEFFYAEPVALDLAEPQS